MGTRSKIQVNCKSENKTYFLYKHWDGYPSDNLKMIYEALRDLRPVNLMMNFVSKCERYYGRENMAEACLTYTPSAIYLDDYTLQDDLEYFYIVDLDEKTVSVYGGRYGDEKTLFNRGPINPLIEIDSYTEEYRPKYLEVLNKVLTDLHAIGVDVNPVGRENKSFKQKYFKAFLKFTGTTGRQRKMKFQSIELFKIDYDDCIKDQARAMNEAMIMAKKEIEKNIKALKEARVQFEYFESEGIFESWHMLSSKAFAQKIEVES